MTRKIVGDNQYEVAVTSYNTRVLLAITGPGGGRRARVWLCASQLKDLMVGLGAAQGTIDAWNETAAAQAEAEAEPEPEPEPEVAAA